MKGNCKRVKELEGSCIFFIFGLAMMYPETYRNFFIFRGEPLENATVLVKKRYVYSYDALNRLTAATGSVNSNYNVSGIQYDKNGNILNLARKGHLNANATNFGVMDNLVYTYDSGNKLLKINDSGSVDYGFKEANTSTLNDYYYDPNGNLTSVTNRYGVDNYNHLNLPTKIAQNRSSIINYVYDATGVKLRKLVTENGNRTITDYAGNYIYENNDLQFFNHPEGYVKTVIASGSAAISSFEYVYQYKDHLGNIRLSYTDNNNDGVITASTEIIEEKNYYPFGLKQKGYNNNVSSLGNSTAQKWAFRKKELEEDLGLNLYDYGARRYDASIARWTSIDPASELMRRFSTYNYVFNNPLVFIDPDGMLPEDIIVKGANGSSLTIATDLIDVTVDASSLGLDFRGNHTVSGDDAVITGLDIVGTIDPTPISDGLAMTMSAKQGDYWGAAASLAGLVIPYAGDLAKGPKIAKGVNKIMKAIDSGKGTVKTAAKETAEKAVKSSDDIPDTIYRSGRTNDSAIKDVQYRPGEDAVSFREHNSNPLDGATVMKPGKPYMAVDTSKLPKGTVTPDGGKVVNGKVMPSGHVSVTATPEEIVNAIDKSKSGKYPKKK